MGAGDISWAWATVAMTASASLVTAVLAAFLTARWASKREREADWRRLKLARYQEFIDATSGLIEGRSTDATIVRFHDIANSLLLVAPKPVLNALWAFLEENSVKNPHRSPEGSDRTLDALVRAMRQDMGFSKEDEPSRQFGFIRPPPGIKVEC